MAMPTFCLPANSITDADFTKEEKIKYPHPCHGCFEIKMFYGQCGLCNDPTYGIVRNGCQRRVTDFAHKNEIVVNGKTYPPAKYDCLYCRDEKVHESIIINDPRLTIEETGGPSGCYAGPPGEHTREPVLVNLPCVICCPQKFCLYIVVSSEKITTIPKEEVLGKKFKLVEKGTDYELIPVDQK